MSNQQKLPRRLRFDLAVYVLGFGIVFLSAYVPLLFFLELPIARTLARYPNNPPVPEGVQALIPQTSLEGMYFMEGFAVGGFFCTFLAACVLLFWPWSYSFIRKEAQK